jgi:DNA transformation protein
MPTAPDPFIEHVRELLSGLGPVAARRMFGGWGLSVDGMNVGIVAWDTLYLKTNAETESRLLAAGARPFVYEAKGKPMTLRYHTAPDDAMESPTSMLPWARLALQAALAARAPGKPQAARPARKTRR